MRSVLPDHVLPAGTASLEPVTQNWLADDAYPAGPLREPAVPPLRQADDEAGRQGAATDATPALTAGTDRSPARPGKRTGLSARAQDIRSRGPMTITPTRRHPHHTGGDFARLSRRLHSRRHGLPKAIWRA
jgi:hypothetical protein